MDVYKLIFFWFIVSKYLGFMPILYTCIYLGLGGKVYEPLC